MSNPFRSEFYQESLKRENILTHNEFMVVQSDINGQFVRIKEINDMIECGAISIDFDKLEEYIHRNTLVTI